MQEELNPDAGPEAEMLALEGVSHQFGGLTALRNVDLTVPRGRTTVLIGPSGCGKSTLLRLMIGLLWPSRGTLRFDGATLTPERVGDQRLRMGYVIQDGGLFPHLSAEANITLMARHLKWAPARIDARLAALSELAGLEPAALARYPDELSGGQRQRVALMRALMLDPDVLLLDEPLAALDAMIRLRLQGDLRDIFRTLNKTVVMVTHDLAEAAFFADMIVLMRAGEIVQKGPFETLVKAPAEPFVSAFISAQRGLARPLAEVGS